MPASLHTQLLALHECVVALAASFGLTVGGKSGAAELRDCADVDGDSAVTSNEAASMLTSCMSYKGGPPLSETGRATLRGLALGC